VADVHRVERATEDTDSLDPGSLRATQNNAFMFPERRRHACALR
jgi:hypothetical protein